MNARTARGCVLLLALTACACAEGSAAGAVTTTPASGQQVAIAKVWHARCGACHRRVEPGTRERTQLSQALTRHRKRVHLSEQEWSALIAFLAASNAHGAVSNAAQNPRLRD